MGNSLQAVAKEFKVHARTVQRWFETWQQTGDVQERPGRGRRAILGPGTAKKALAMLKDPTVGTAAAAAKKLKAKGFTAKVVSPNTVLRAAREVAAGKVAYTTRPPPKALTARNKAARLAFARANRTRDWKRVMFTDRCKFTLACPGVPMKRGGYVERGERRAGVLRRNPPWAYNIYVGLTMHGLTKVHAVAGTSSLRSKATNQKGHPARSITKGQYREVLLNTFIPEGRRLLVGSRRSGWVLQQDGDRSHSGSEAVVKGSEDGRAGVVELLPMWPANSPDLSPIENVWSIVQARVNALGCSTREKWELAIQKELAAFPKDMITAMYDGMPQRMQQVIDCKGDKIKH